MEFGIRRQSIDYHRIQNKKAIVSITLVKGSLLDKDGRIMTWTGDGYELLEELQSAIQKLEEKERKKRGLNPVIPD